MNIHIHLFTLKYKAVLFRLVPSLGRMSPVRSDGGGGGGGDGGDGGGGESAPQPHSYYNHFTCSFCFFSISDVAGAKMKENERFISPVEKKKKKKVLR